MEDFLKTALASALGTTFVALVMLLLNHFLQQQREKNKLIQENIFQRGRERISISERR
jgi:hypothetical protein